MLVMCGCIGGYCKVAGVVAGRAEMAVLDLDVAFGVVARWIAGELPRLKCCRVVGCTASERHLHAWACCVRLSTSTSLACASGYNTTLLPMAIVI